MEKLHFKTSFTVDQSPKQVFDAVLNVRGWWSENITGNTANVNDEFDYHYQDVHRSKMRLTEVEPNRRVVWLVLQNEFKFTADKHEWTGNHIVFDINEVNGRTELVFTQVGLTTDYECYKVCSHAWTMYVQDSLFNLITTGKGKPTRASGYNEIEEGIVRKWADEGSNA